MIDYLDQVKTKEGKNGKENSIDRTAIDIRNYFNRSLINKDDRKYFNDLFDKYYKCLLCYDTIFDPVHCSNCQLVFCRSCTSNKDLLSQNLKCNHAKLSTKLPTEEQTKFGNIRVNCFFNCSEKSLNLLNYAAHIKLCRETYEQKTSIDLKKELQKKDSLIRELQTKLAKFSNTGNEILSEEETTFRELIKKNINPEQTTLNLNGKTLGDIHIKYLSQCNSLDIKGLTQLDLSENNIGAEGMESLSKCGFSSLSQLNLSKCKIGKKGMESLSKCGFKLTHLNLRSNDIGEGGMEFLLKCGYKSITHLNLRSNNIGIKGMEILAKCEYKSLTQLNLWNNNIGTEGMRILATCDFKLLTQLFLFGNNIGKEGMKHLTKCDFKILDQLVLWNNNIGKEGMEYLPNCDFKALTQLILTENNIGDEGMAYLPKCNFKSLTHLDISINKIGNDGMQHLSNCDFKGLTQLIVEENNVGKEGLEYLTKCDFKSLTELILTENNLGEDNEAVKKRLLEVFPGVTEIDI